jgi:hypothetical protein
MSIIDDYKARIATKKKDFDTKPDDELLKEFEQNGETGADLNYVRGCRLTIIEMSNAIDKAQDEFDLLVILKFLRLQKVESSVKKGYGQTFDNLITKFSSTIFKNTCDKSIDIQIRLSNLKRFDEIDGLTEAQLLKFPHPFIRSFKLKNLQN